MAKRKRIRERGKVRFSEYFKELKEGDKVAAGQGIALSGASEAPKPMIHFEVRQAGKSVYPMRYLK